MALIISVRSVVILFAVTVGLCYFSDCSLASTPSINATRGSFASWDKWLSKFIDDDDPEENMAAALFKVGRIKKSERDQLGQAIDQLKIISEAQDCDASVVRALEKIAAGSNPPLGESRIDKLAMFFVAKVYEKCEKFLAGELHRLVEQSKASDKQLDRFFSVMVPVQLRQTVASTSSGEVNNNKLYQSLAEADSLAPESELSDLELARNLKLLSLEDSRSVFSAPEDAKSPIYLSNFKYAFNRYLVEPCKFYDRTFGDHFDSVFALKSLSPELASHSGGETRVGPALATNPVHLNNLPDEWFAGLFRLKMCAQVLNMSMARLRQIFHEIQAM